MCAYFESVDRHCLTSNERCICLPREREKVQVESEIWEKNQSGLTN